MEYLIETKSKRTKALFDAIVPRMLKELKLERSRKALLIKVSKQDLDGQEGSTVALDVIDSYVVLIKPNCLIIEGNKPSMKALVCLLRD